MAQIPNASTLLRVRKAFLRTLPFSATIIKPVDTTATPTGKNADGSDSDDTDRGIGGVQINVDHCGVSPLGSPSEVIDSEALQALRTWLIKFPVGTNVSPGDKVSVGGFLYHVVDTNQGKSNQFTLQCVARKLVPGGQE